MCGSIAIPFRAAPAVSDICVSNDGPIRHYFPSRRRQAWTARARVTGISPLRGSLRAAPTACGCGWTGVSLLDCRRGSGRTPAESCRNAKQPATGCFMDGWEPLCTVSGRLRCGRSPHRWWWRILRCRCSLPLGGLSPADVSKLPDMTASRRCFSKFNEDMFSSHLIRQKSAFLKPSFKVFFYFLYCRDNRFSDCSMGNPLYLSDPCQGISIQKEAESALLEIS